MIWYMVPEMWSTTDIIFVILDHFLRCPPRYGTRKSKLWRNEQHTWRYYHFINVYHKWQSHDIWFLRYDAWRTEFFVIWNVFCHFTPLTTWKIQILKNWQKTPGYIITLHMCAINDNQMMYGSWDIERERQIFLSFWTIFCSFYPRNNPKYQNFEKMKKSTWRYFTKVYQKSESYVILFLRYGAWRM